MASPALASPPGAPLDPHKQARFTLQLGQGITSKSSSSSFRSVKRTFLYLPFLACSNHSTVNHKPDLSDGTRSARIAATNSNQPNLTITDEEDGTTSKYKYVGHRGSTKNSYVLIFDQNKQTCVLEPLASSYAFNIQSTPWEKSADKLSQTYQQLQPKTDEEDFINSNGHLDEDADGEPDPDNPYDYRHYLNYNGRGASPLPSPALPPSSSINTPRLASSRPTATPEVKARSRPATKVDPLRPAQRKRKSPPPAAAKSTQRPTPTVRIDRRASTRPGDEKKKSGPRLPKPNAKSDYYVHSSDEAEMPPTSQPVATRRSSPSDLEEDEEDEHGGGGLEIDFGDAPLPKRKGGALGFSGSSRGGPISLHSAANSPDSRVVTPRQNKKSSKEDDVIDFGDTEGYEEDDDSDTDAPHAADQGGRKQSRDQDIHMRDADDEDADADGDEDVDPLILGSPAHQQQPVLSDEDEDADLDAAFEAEMLQAMQDDDDGPAAAAEESEEESEAE